MLDTGQIIADRYELLKRLGRGGFSEVWLAQDKLTEVKVAIKIYAPGTGLDDAGISLFTQEFSLVFDMNHTNLLHPTYYDCWERMPYLILPFCKNGSAFKYLVGEELITETECWHLLHDVAEGLAYLHAKIPPVIHQDIKPDNILITTNGRHVKLIDLGFAYSDCYSAIACGTHAYSAPEQFASPRSASLRADVYAFGNVIRYITPYCTSVVRRATRSNPEERYPSIDTLMRDLQRIRGRRYLMIAIGLCGIILFGILLSLFLQHSTQTSDESHDNASIKNQLAKNTASEAVESVELKQFRQAIQTVHKQAFTRYYATILEINEENYDEAVRLCADCFNQARTMEDSLRRCYTAQDPSIERELNAVIEQEMAVSMSKHLSMLNAYNQQNMNKSK